MADVAPMADEYRQLSGKSTTPLVHDIVCVHTMVGTLEGSISWSSRDGGSYWHFGLGGKGKLVQCQDLRFRSAANLQGNWHVIPIETADIKEGVFPDTWQNPPWTNAQIDKLVELIAWLCVRYNIPPVLIPDTKPGRRGLAYHRQGIVPQLVAGGEKWSNSDYKSCPANRAVQFTSIVIPRVQAALKQGDWFDMATEAELTTIVRREVSRAVQYVAGGRNNAVFDPSKLEWMAEAVTLPGLRDEVTALVQAELAAALPAIKTELTDVVRGEVTRAVQYMAGGRNNAVFDPAKANMTWMAEAVTLPQIKAAVDTPPS